MIKLTGILRKMSVKHVNNQAYYYFSYAPYLDQQKIQDAPPRMIQESLNDYLGKPLKLHFGGQIYCIASGKKTKKSFNQGYSYESFLKLAACDSCIMSPEKCHYHLGTCREPDWGLRHCFAPHVVYLSNSSQMKVGITRKEQIPTRFIDQGASWALPMIEVKSRYHSGLIETKLKELIHDRTHWKKMLQQEIDYIDLISKANELKVIIDEYALKHNISVDWLPFQELKIEYPILEIPKKFSSLDLEKLGSIEGELLGIKGQYLILDSGVINLRKYTGYLVNIELMR